MNSSQSHAPIYFRIQQAMLEQIRSGVLKPGQQLPTEIELAQQYQVSRITAKRALDELVRQGRAFRQQGRGTFVAQRHVHDIAGFGSFSEDMLARGLTPSSRVLQFTQLRADQEISERLHISAGEQIYCLKRLRLANDQATAVETAFLPCRLYEGLLDFDLSHQSLYAVLRAHYKLLPTWADAEIEARAATAEEAHLLHIEAEKPVLHARRVTFSENYDVLEFVYSVYSGERFTLYTGRQYIG